MGHLAGCVSRKPCGSVEGSEVVCHLKRWQKHKTCAVAAFSTLLVERAARTGTEKVGQNSSFAQIKKGVRSLGARGVRESPRHASRGMLLWLFYLMCVYLCFLGPVVKALPQPCQVSRSFMSGTSPTERCSQSSSGSSSSTLTGAE